MMKTSLLASALLIACCFSTASETVAQTTTATKQLPTYIGEIRGFIGDGLGQFRTVPAEEVDLSKPTVIGNTFLNDQWEKGNLYLTLNRKLEDQYIKYDIEQNQILLHGEASSVPSEESDDYKTVSGVSVLAFEINDPLEGNKVYINSVNAGFTKGGTPYPGFMEVLVEGPLNLYRKVETSILKANYHVAFNAGEKRDRIVKKEMFFVKRADEKELHEISNKKKDNLKLFNKKQVEGFVKENKTNFKQQDDLVRVVTYYNTL